MRTVNFRDGIVYPISHLLGIDPKADLNKDHAAAWASFVNSRVREAWTYWPWPDLTVTEERPFRPKWSATRPVQVGDEIFYLPTFSYYKAIATPPEGTLPTDPLYYSLITLSDYYLDFDQAGARPISEVFGIYGGNPRMNGSGLGHPVDYRPRDVGVSVFGAPHGQTVFVHYLVRPFEFSLDEYDSSKTYRRGDVVYWLDDGNCYKAKQQMTGHSPAESGYWFKQLMPYVLAEFVKYAVAADAIDDLQSMSVLRADADRALEREAGKLAKQGQVFHYSRGRCCGYWSVAPMGAPWGTDGSTTTLTDGDDPFAEEGDTMLDSGLQQINNGESFAQVNFASWAGGPAYSFLELEVRNTVDAPPMNIFPTTIVQQNEDGFRVFLNSAPDNNNYFLKWRIAL